MGQSQMPDIPKKCIGCGKTVLRAAQSRNKPARCFECKKLRIKKAQEAHKKTKTTKRISPPENYWKR